MQKIVSFVAHDNYVLGLKFTTDNQTLVSGGMDSVIKLWSAADWKLKQAVTGHANSVHTLDLAPDEKFLATGSTDCTVKLWSYPAMGLLHSWQDRKKTVSAVSFSPDGRWVGAGSYGGRVAIWTRDGVPVLTFAAAKKNLSSIAFAPNGKLLAAAGLGDDITLWSLPEGEQVGTLKGHEIAVGSLRFIQDGRILVSLGYERAIRLWDTATWETAAEYQLDSKTQTRAALFSPDESQVAISMESMVQLWRVDPGELQAIIPIGTKSVGSMAYSDDGRLLAIGGADKKIRIWSLV
jgi:WD40 repeat protein